MNSHLGLSLDTISAKSGVKAYWQCLVDPEHVWKSAVSSRTRKSDEALCPFCTGRKVLPGNNSFAVYHPELLKEWDYEKNTIDPDHVSKGSKNRVHWICSINHSHKWETRINHRTTSGSGCPYCAGTKVMPKGNSLSALRPDLALEWDFDLNSITPEEVTAGSGRRAHWICSKNPEHKWDAVICSRSSGHGCPYCSGNQTIPGEGTLYKLFPHLLNEWDWERNNDNPYDLAGKSNKKINWVCSFDSSHKWSSQVDKRTHRGDGCPICSHLVSKGEKEISDFVSRFTEVKTSDRSVISPYELDIYIPSKNIAIEFNGLYWHSTAYRKDKNYHKKKADLCKEKGIQLITVWEDDWKFKKDIVKKMLLHKIGVSEDKRIYARKTLVDSDVSLPEAREFQIKHHIQGPGAGCIRIGLRDSEGTLVALSVFKRAGDTLELVRYCTSCTVVGGQSKILKWVDNNITYTKMKTFADRTLSTGDLYEKTGWINDGEIPPDYYYLVGDRREHKFGYRLARFKKDPNLLYEEGLSEAQLAEINGLHRIYDCGKVRYIRYSK